MQASAINYTNRCNRSWLVTDLFFTAREPWFLHISHLASLAPGFSFFIAFPWLLGLLVVKRGTLFFFFFICSRAHYDSMTFDLRNPSSNRQSVKRMVPFWKCFCISTIGRHYWDFSLSKKMTTSWWRRRQLIENMKQADVRRETRSTTYHSRFPFMAWSIRCSSETAVRAIQKGELYGWVTHLSARRGEDLAIVGSSQSAVPHISYLVYTCFIG